MTPAGVSKGSGVWVALSRLGPSRHNVVAVGDAEIDLSMLRDAEVSVAVHDAVAARVFLIAAIHRNFRRPRRAQ